MCEEKKEQGKPPIKAINIPIEKIVGNKNRELSKPVCFFMMGVKIKKQSGKKK